MNDGRPADIDEPLARRLIEVKNLLLAVDVAALTAQIDRLVELRAAVLALKGVPEPTGPTAAGPVPDPPAKRAIREKGFWRTVVAGALGALGGTATTAEIAAELKRTGAVPRHEQNVVAQINTCVTHARNRDAFRAGPRRGERNIRTWSLVAADAAREEPA